MSDQNQEQGQTKKKKSLDENNKNMSLNLETFCVEPEILQLIPKQIAAKYVLIPLYQQNEVLHLAMADAQNPFKIDEVRRLTQVRAILPHPADRNIILAAIDRNYGLQERVQDILQNIQKERMEEGTPQTVLGQESPVEMAAEEAPVIKLVNHIILGAVQDRASDIHFEPEEKYLRVRLRLDGQLKESYIFQKTLESAILTRIKIVSGMDISEKRKPQDGRILFRLESKQIDIRVSSLPTLYGENLVLRILDKTAVSHELSKLGMEGSLLQEFKRLIHFPHGILLATGPTGSGKSTTLYAALNEVLSIEKNIVTVEDPIEYNLELVRQTQVNPKIGLTFATGLRSILRQDPDIIMVGEIRDTETAEIAVQAALTGHLVLSTLHTNDACGAVTRLQDMGIPPYLIASSVIGILAQRLVRKICPDCKRSVEVPTQLLKELKLEGVPGMKFYGGTGCETCKNQRYSGRTAIHEFVVLTDEIRNLIIRRADLNTLRLEARKQGMRPLREAGFEKVRLGITSLEEILNVTEEV